MIVGGYSLDLYCEYTAWSRDDVKTNGATDDAGHDHLEEQGEASFYGRSEAQCLAKARKNGWRINFGKALCPTCVLKNRKLYNDARKGWLPGAPKSD